MKLKFKYKIEDVIMEKRKLIKEAYWADGATFMNKDEVLNSNSCGCKKCGILFPANLIKEWKYEIQITEKLTTASAVCPYCLDINVIPESESYMLDEKLIKYMQKPLVKMFLKLCRKLKV